jgi:pimeloyl-ACP methyl ester carboxylesterase
MVQFFKKFVAKSILGTALLFLTAIPGGNCEKLDAVTGPSQPDSGPGGASYTHNSVNERSYGEGNLQYWLLEPADPKPESAPVVIFSHGWSAMNPHYYSAWLRHIVRRGNIVIYPRYQGTLRTPPPDFSSNAIAATATALKQLQTEEGHVRPQLDKVTAVGHSAGGNISASIAARAASKGLPVIKAVMCVEPGKSWGPKGRDIPLDDVSTMPASTLLLTVVGDQDNVVKDIDAKRIINESVLVPAANKNLVRMISDEHGEPPLKANHFSPTGTVKPGSQNNEAGDKGVDALDYFGTWKLFDALEDASIYGKNRDYALGGGPHQTYMGKWSDGVPVKELEVQVGSAK